MKKLFVYIGFVWVLILMLGTMSAVNALEFDNVKDVGEITIDKIVFDGREITEYVKEYPKIDIENAFGLPLIGDTLFEGYLSQHDTSCGIECKSTIELKTYGDSPLVQDIYFETILEDESRVRQDVRSYQFYIKTNQSAYEVDDYEWQCTPTGKISINGTEEQSCENVLIGTHTEYEPEWAKYTIGEVLPKGVYTLKLEADKKPSRTVDWVIKTNGEWLEEWATWGSSDLVNDVVSYYRLDNSTGVVYDMLATNDGTNNGATRGVTGIIENSFQFDGGTDDYVDTGFSVASYTEATFSAWVNQTNPTFSDDIIISQRNADLPLFGTRISGTTEGNVAKFTTRLGGTFYQAIGTTNISDGEWHLVTGTWNGTGLTIYVDGVAEGHGDLASMPSIGGTLYIGSEGYNAQEFEGNIDEVGIWDIALTSGEIGELYSSGNGNTYPFSQGQVTLNSPTDDSISDSNNVQFNATAGVTGGATLTNMSLWTNETGSWALKNTTDVTAVEGTGEQGTNLEVVNVGNNSYTMSFTSLTTSGIVKSIQLGTSDGSSMSSNVSVIQNGITLAYKETASYVYNTAPLVTFTVEDYSDHIYSAVDGGNFQVKVERIGGTGNQGIKTSASSFSGTLFEYSSQSMTARHSGQPANPIITFNQTTPTSTSSTQTWNRTITDPIIWNVQACDSDGDCGFAVSNYSLSIDTTAPTIDILYPTGTIDYGYNGQNISLNYSISDTNLESCWYDYNGTNVSTSCTENSSIISESNNLNITMYANDSVGNVGSLVGSWDYKLFQNSFAFENETRAGDQEDFSMNVTLGTGIDLDSVVFHYNGETETPEIFSSGQDRIFNVSDYAVPLLQVDTNVTLFFEIALVDATEINTSTQVQLLQAIFLDNCSSYTNELFNISLYDEETKTPLDGDIEFNYKLINVPAYEEINNLNLSFTNVSNARVCSDINLTDENFVQSIEIRYVSAGYAPELYHIQRAEINDETQTLNLYDLNSSSSTEFKLTYQDDTFNFVEGAIVQLLRKYISEDVYEVVEAPLTSNEGVSVVHVDLDSVKYKVIITKDGTILDTFDNIVFKCQSELTEECEQKLLGKINPQNNIPLTTLQDFSYTVSEVDNTVTVTYSIPSGSPSSVNLVLVQKDQFGNTTMCNQTVTSSAGSISCDYDDSIGDSYIDLTISKDGDTISIRSYLVPEANSIDWLGNNYIIVVILLLSLVGMAVTSPEWMVINSIITLLVAGSLWLLNGISFGIGLGMLMWLIIAAGILILKLAKQEDK